MGISLSTSAIAFMADFMWEKTTPFQYEWRTKGYYRSSAATQNS
jgi:hypothetical protein